MPIYHIHIDLWYRYIISMAAKRLRVVRHVTVAFCKEEKDKLEAILAKYRQTDPRYKISDLVRSLLDFEFKRLGLHEVGKSE